MLVFGTEMHIVTFIFSAVELLMLVFLLPNYISKPQNKPQLWYLILLFLLISYNITGGLLSDRNFTISVINQNIIAYGSGFLIASYFSYYFYKAFNLESLRFHALYGAPAFLMLPYLIFFCLLYPILGNLEVPTSYGMIVPFFYSIWVLYSMLGAIINKIKDRSNSSYSYNKMEMVAVYIAVTPWVTMAIFAYLSIEQWIEVSVTNLGFLVITVLFISKSIRQAKIEQEKLWLLDIIGLSEDIFEANLQKYDFTFREMEIIQLIRMGLSHQEVADRLFIAPTTVSRHVQNIHYNSFLSLSRRV